MRSRPTHTDITDEAARWLCELQDPAVTSRARAACIRWLKKSPAHVREFLHVAAIWKGLDQVDTRQLDLEQLIAEASAKVVPLQEGIAPIGEPERSSSVLARLRSRWVAAAALVAMAVALAIWSPSIFDRTETYATAVGEQRALRLADGSVVNLNTRSRIEVRFAEHSRDIRLLEGEALFTVAHDATRPFRVSSGDSVIQALGTQFNVYRREDATTVSVLEGVVQLTMAKKADEAAVAREDIAAGSNAPQPSPTKLTAGEEAEVRLNGQIEKRTAPDIAQAAAWRERKLIFRGDPLNHVAAEINRYNDAVQVRVEGAARDRRIIGVFAADDPESLLQFLSSEGEFVIERRSGEIVVSGGE